MRFIATVCGPRQNNLRFPGVDSVLRVNAQEWFEAEYATLWAPIPNTPAPAPADAPAPATAHPQYAGASFLDFLMNLSNVPGAAPAVQADAEEEDSDDAAEESEAQKYLSSPDVAMDCDILVWWANHELEYPHLSVMARQYLSMPTTSASAERLFSIAGRVFDDLRKNMR